MNLELFKTEKPVVPLPQWEDLLLTRERPVNQKGKLIPLERKPDIQYAFLKYKGKEVAVVSWVLKSVSEVLEEQKPKQILQILQFQGAKQREAFRVFATMNLPKLFAAYIREIYAESPINEIKLDIKSIEYISEDIKDDRRETKYKALQTHLNQYFGFPTKAE